MVAMGEPDPCSEPHPRKLHYVSNRFFAFVQITYGYMDICLANFQGAD